MTYLDDAQLRALYAGSVDRAQHNKSLLDSGNKGDRSACPSPEELLLLVSKRGSRRDEQFNDSIDGRAGSGHPNDSASSDARILGLLDHVMSCKECHSEMALLRAVESAGRSLEAESSAISQATNSQSVNSQAAKSQPADNRAANDPSARASSFSFKRWGYAATMFATFAIVAFGVNRMIGPDDKSVTRGRADSLQLHLPTAGWAANTADSTIFAWQPVERAVEYQFEVLHPDGYSVVTLVTTDTLVTIQNLKLVAVGDGAEDGSVVPTATGKQRLTWWVRALLPDGTSERSAVRDLTINIQ